MLAADFEEIVTAVDKFVSREITPKVLEAEKVHHVEWPRMIWAKSEIMKLPELLVPESHGGAGMPELCAGLVLDVLSSGCAGIASIFAHHYAGCFAISAGSQSQKDKYLRLLSNADFLQPNIVTTIWPGYLEENRLTLKESDGRLVLSGVGPLTGNAFLADHFVAFVQDPEKRQERTCLIVPRNAPGLSVEKSANLPGLKTNPFSRIIFRDVEIPPDSVIGKAEQGREIFEAVFHLFSAFVSAMAMGVSRTAYRKARLYAEERYQYGKNIIHHSEIQRKLGRMRMQISVGTAAYLTALKRENLGLAFSTPKGMYAKIYCTESAEEVATEAVQIHGGYGYMHEYGVEKLMRDAKVLCLLGGSGSHLCVEDIAGQM